MKNILGLMGLLAVACVTDEDIRDGRSGSSSSCEDNVCILTGIFLEDLHLTADNIYLLRGGVYIGDDVGETTLTIDAGVKIYGESSSDGMLVVTRNSKIIAEGTADAPIVFTSSKEEGSRTRGDWGGIIINGNAPINSCGDGGFCEAFGEGATGYYGGDNPEDNSGILRYVRVEFAGTLVSPDNELNGIALQGVGSGTTLDYIQVHMNADDGVEFFGGNADIKHLVVSGVGDDSLDWTDGWSGRAQYVVLQQHPDAGDNGIEADNNGENNVSVPMSNPTLSNMTIIGSDGPSSDLGILLREGTGAYIVNTVVYGWDEASLDIDGPTTWDNADSGFLAMESVCLDSKTNFKEDPDEARLVSSWFYGGHNNIEGGFAIVDPQNTTEPNFLPETIIHGAIKIDDLFFDDVDYVGAMADSDWSLGWTAYPER